MTLDMAGTLNHLQYVNRENSLGYDKIANSMNVGHISSLLGQPTSWDDRSSNYKIPNQ